MVELSIVISSLISEGSRLVKTLVYGLRDRKTHLEAMPFGVDAVPVENIRAVVVQSATSEERIVLGYVNTNQEAEPGEYRIYSLGPDGETLATYMWLKTDGTIEIGGDARTAVKFQELKTAFDELKQDFNDLVDHVDNHEHDGVIVTVSGGSGGPAIGTPGSSNPPTSNATPSVADIDPAEQPNVKLAE